MVFEGTLRLWEGVVSWALKKVDKLPRATSPLSLFRIFDVELKIVCLNYFELRLKLNVLGVIKKANLFENQYWKFKVRKNMFIVRHVSI